MIRLKVPLCKGSPCAKARLACAKARLAPQRNMSHDSESENEWARDICSWGRRDCSPSAVERAIQDQLDRRPNALAMWQPAASSNSASMAPEVQRDDPNIKYIFVAGRGRCPGTWVNGKLRLLPSHDDQRSQPVAVRAQLPETHRQATSSLPSHRKARLACAKARLAPQCIVTRTQSQIDTNSSARAGSTSTATPSVTSSNAVAPAQPPPGPLELPRHDDSDSEDSCDEEYDSKLGIVVEPHPRYFPYIIARRLKRARSVGIIDDWCRSISFSPEAYRVLPICIERIERERVRRGGTRFKVGITHCPTWRFVAAPYAYCRDAPPWGTMNVLWVSDCVDQGQQLETDLITHFKLAETVGRANINPGGENPPRVAPVFVYCVFGFGPYGGSHDARAYMAARARRVRNKRSRR